MKKKTTTQPPTSQRKYKVGDEFIYHNGRDIMTRVRIEEVLENGYLLSNQVRINEFLKRTDDRADRYPHFILPITEGSQRLHDGYHAFLNLRRLMQDLDREMQSLTPFSLTEEQTEKYIRILKKLKKAIEK